MNRILLPILLSLMFSWSALAQHAGDYRVLLHGDAVEFPENIREFQTQGALQAKEEIEGIYYRYLQFYQIPGKDAHRQIEARGIQLLDYLPYRAYLAAIPTSVQADELQALGVRSIMPIHRDWKLAPALLRDPIQPWAFHRGQVEVIIKFYRNIPAEHAEAYFKADGITLLRNNGYNNFVAAMVHPHDIGALAELPYVAFVDLHPGPGEPDDHFGRSLHRSNMIDSELPGGYHYTGEGVSVLVRDDGGVGPHIDFQGRMTNMTAGLGGTHGDGVGGIMSGAGNLRPTARGMAAGTHMYVINYQADFLDNTMDLHFDNDVLVTNSSYSNGCNTGYTAIASTVDQQLFDNPTLMHVFSAGNSNNTNCGYGAGPQWGNITGGHKQGKNAIATANLRRNAIIETSSSRGPAYDGRLKPDISAHGTGQVSANPNNAYQSFGGTSAAAPGIAGIMAQLHQAYREMNNGEIARASLLKAALLVTANDLGNVGPDFIFGWGHVNALRALKLLEENRYFKANIEQDVVQQFSINIPSGVRMAKIMVYWHDKEAAPEASIALINDLDMRIVAPTGDVLLPLVLNPTPNATALNSVAEPGEDHLNNMEAVWIKDPEAGSYTLEVEGFAIPFGEHEYEVVYEFLTDEITVIYPSGGEGWVPGVNEIIHWDAYGDDESFEVELSTDNGSSWISLGSVAGNLRLLSIDAPEVFTSEARVRVSRTSGSASSGEAFSIVRVPQNLSVTQACPDFIRLEWNAVPDAQQYEVFLLGEKYMESVGVTSELFFEVPAIQNNPTLEHWMSVRAYSNNGLRGLRADAVFYNGGLLECPLDNDLAILQLINPVAESVSGCQEYNEAVSFVVRNNGSEPQENFTVAYQFDNQAPVSFVVEGPLGAGETTTVEFPDPIQITESGTFAFVAWIQAAVDQAAFNDTTQFELVANIFPTGGETPNYTEDFESGTPPDFWFILNPDGGITWQAATVTGITGASTTCMRMNNFAYNASGQEDDLVSIPFDLSATGITFPVLTFDVAYAPYNLIQYFDALRVDIYTDCGNLFSSSVYEKAGAVLGTRPATTAVFSPSGPSEWRTESIDLSDFIGESIRVHFVSITGYGNQLYIDNVNLLNFLPAQGGFSVSSSQICTGQFIVVDNEASGDNLSYQWSFGQGAVPPTSTSSNQIIVTYTTPGLKTITQIVSNAVSADTLTFEVNVLATPEASFDVAQDGGTYTFTNTSTYGTSFLWNFGDGNTSTEENPTHTYTDSGEFEVSLTVSNMCGTNSISETLDVISQTFRVDEQLLLQATPNPSDGLFQILIEGARSPQMDALVRDVQGRELFRYTWPTAQGRSAQTLDLRNLPTGVYFLQLQSSHGLRSLKLIVQ
jgi:hypothetical protein